MVKAKPVAITDVDREAARFFDRWLTGANSPGNLRYAFAKHRTEAQAELLEAMQGVANIVYRAESNASGNPEWDHVGPRVAAFRAVLAKVIP